MNDDTYWANRVVPVAEVMRRENVQLRLDLAAALLRINELEDQAIKLKADRDDARSLREAEVSDLTERVEYYLNEEGDRKEKD
jgi:hypothetical protein